MCLQRWHLHGRRPPRDRTNTSTHTRKSEYRPKRLYRYTCPGCLGRPPVRCQGIGRYHRATVAQVCKAHKAITRLRPTLERLAENARRVSPFLWRSMGNPRKTLPLYLPQVVTLPVFLLVKPSCPCRPWSYISGLAWVCLVHG